MAVGAALGVFNGSLVAYGKLPPFIVTLGMLGIARGMVLVLTDASTVQPLPDAFGNIANGDVPRAARTCCGSSPPSSSSPSFVLRRTVFGRYIYAVGSNPESARLAGVPVTRVLVAVYAIAGLLAAVGGVLFTSRLNAGIPTAGTGYELNAIAACVIGGASLFGAKGGAFGAAAGALIVGDPQQRRQPAGHQRLLPADHHRRAHPRRGRLRPVAGPAVPRRMSVDRARGHACRPGRPRRRRRPDRRLLRRAAGPGVPEQRVAFGTSGHRGTSTARHVQRGPRARHRRGGVPLPRRSRASTARCSSGATRTRCPSPRRAAIVEVLCRPRRRRRGRRRRRLHADARRSRTRSSPTTARADGAARPTASSSPRRTTRPRTAASSTTRPTAGRPTPTSPAGSSARPTRCSRTGCAASSARRTASCRAAPPRLRLGLRRRPARGHRPRRRSATSGLRLGVDPLGGASVAYWAAIAERHGLDLTITNDQVDPTFRFVPLDWDGKIRMDCSSPYAMAELTRRCADHFDVAFANDPDADRHGIVTPGAGLLNPNHHLAACIAYLFGGHRDWPRRRRRSARRSCSSAIIDRVGGRPRPARGRGAGRLQVVRRRPARRHARLRRRGERGRLVPAPRRRRRGRPTRTG